MTDVPSRTIRGLSTSSLDLRHLLDQRGHPQQRPLEGRPVGTIEQRGQARAGDEPGGVEVGEGEHPDVGGRVEGRGRPAGPEREHRADRRVVAAPRTDTSTPGPTIGCTSAGMSPSPDGLLHPLPGEAQRPRALEVDGEAGRRRLGHAVPARGLQHHRVAHRRRGPRPPRRRRVTTSVRQGGQPDGVEHAPSSPARRASRRSGVEVVLHEGARAATTGPRAARGLAFRLGEPLGVGRGPAEGVGGRVHGVEHGHGPGRPRRGDGP